MQILRYFVFINQNLNNTKIIKLKMNSFYDSLDLTNLLLF